MKMDQFYVEHKGKIQGPFTFRNLQHFVKTNQITPKTRVQINDSTEWRRAGEIKGLFSPKQSPKKQDPVPVVKPLASQSTQSDKAPEKSKASTTTNKSDVKTSYDWKKLSRQKIWVIGGTALLCIVLGIVFMLGKPSEKKEKQTSQVPDVPKQVSVVPTQIQVPPKQDPRQKEMETFYKTGENFFSQKNYKEAVYWYEKAAELGSLESQCKLGICYSQGLGVSVNKEKAVKYFLKAAQDNNAQAQYELGMCHLNGDGIKQSRNAALKWFRKAADQGFAQAVTAIQEEEAKIAEEKRQAELARQEAERRAEEARQAAERARQEAERKAEEERLAAERRAEEERQAAERKAREPSAGDRIVKTVDGIEYAFRWCPAGTFMMGSPKSEEGHLFETQHEVTLTQGFWMLETEVTQAMWGNVMGYFPKLPHYRKFQYLEDRPMVWVDWKECNEFCVKLSNQIGVKISLPTEAQWEYACRAGTTGPYAGDLDAMGWYHNNAHVVFHPVRQKQPNAWGLYDMHGNVEEWCQDFYAPYSKDSAIDPMGPEKGRLHVVRGGHAWSFDFLCRSAYRFRPGGDEPKWSLRGFRVVATNQ